MLITNSAPHATLRPASLPRTEATSVTLNNEPIDGWNPGSSEALAELFPYSAAVIGTAAGLAAGFAGGPAAMAGGAVAGVAAGVTGSALFSAVEYLGTGDAHYARNAAVGAGVGAAAGALAGAVGGPVVGIGAALIGGGGAYFLATAARGY